MFQSLKIPRRVRLVSSRSVQRGNRSKIAERIFFFIYLFFSFLHRDTKTVEISREMGFKAIFLKKRNDFRISILYLGHVFVLFQIDDGMKIDFLWIWEWGNLKEEELKKICKFFSSDNIYRRPLDITIIKLQKDVNVWNVLFSILFLHFVEKVLY